MNPRVLLLAMTAGCIGGLQAPLALAETPPENASPQIESEAQPESLRPLAELIAAGSHGEAFELASDMLDERAGEPHFDYLYGLAALESGHPDKAAFAFERILIVQPDHHRARAELARTHFLVGNISAARREFERVLAADPPEKVRERVEMFLAEIEEREAVQQRSYGLVGGFGLGYDSNINSASDLDSITIDVPELGVTFSGPLPDEAKPTSDLYHNWGLDFDVTQPISRQRAVRGTAGIEHKNNFDSSDFDLTTADLGTSVRQSDGPNVYMAGIRGRHVHLGSDRLLWSLGLNGQWQRRLGDHWAGGAFAELSTIRHPDAHERDRNRFLLGGSAIFMEGPLRMRGSLFHAIAPARDSDNKHQGRSVTGVAVNADWELAPRHSAIGSLGFNQVDYDETHPTFGKTRDDTVIRASLGWAWEVTPQLDVRSELRYDEVDSNIDLFEFDRTRIEAGIKYRFF